MGKQPPKNQLSETEIRAIYGQGEEAVVSLVSQLMARLSQLEAEVKELKRGTGRGTVVIVVNHRPAMALANVHGAYGVKVRSSLRRTNQPSGGTLEWCSLPDFVEQDEVASCSSCGHSLAAVPVDRCWRAKYSTFRP